MLDLGTGHGNVIRAFAPHFERAVGADLSPGMLELARTLTEEKGVRTRSGGAVRFVAGGAEVMEDVEGVGEGSVDLITAATAVSSFVYPSRSIVLDSLNHQARGFVCVGHALSLES